MFATSEIVLEAELNKMGRTGHHVLTNVFDAAKELGTSISRQHEREVRHQIA